MAFHLFRSQASRDGRESGAAIQEPIIPFEIREPISVAANPTAAQAAWGGYP